VRYVYFFFIHFFQKLACVLYIRNGTDTTPIRRKTRFEAISAD
jgi:hypothetical protein